MAQEKKLQEAKRLYETANSDQRYVLESLFPELKESEDERIRKMLIEFFGKGAENNGSTNGISDKDILAWLERQGKKPIGIRSGHATGKLGEIIKDIESADKVEPKFKVGDWIVNKGHSYLIADIDYEQRRYLFEIGGYTHEQLNLEYIENADNKYHRWTVEDAKDGDVLYSPCFSLLWIFKSRNTVYCCYSLNYNDGNFCGEGYSKITTDAIPATKIQRDLFFKKMKEAGYEWDAETKELKRIDNEIEIPLGAKDSELQEDTYYIPKGFHAEIDADKVVIKKGAQKSAWNEEDESILQGIRDEILANKHDAKEYEWKTYDKFLNWLKTLKQRIGG